MRTLVAALLVGLAAVSGATAGLPAEGTGLDAAGLAFGRSPDGMRWSIWVARADGSGARRLVARGLVPRLSPDGRLVAYRACGPDALDACDDLSVVPVAGGTPPLLVARPERRYGYVDAVWSPDGASLAVDTSKRLLLVDPSTGAGRELARGRFYGMSFSPEGDALVYARGTTGNVATADVDLYLVSLADGSVSRLTDNGRSHSPVFGRSGIAFFRYRLRGPWPFGHVYLIQPDGTGLRRLTRVPTPVPLGLRPVEFSDDGRRLLACYQAEFSCPPFGIRVDTGRTRWIGTRLRGLAYAAGLSADGREVLVEAGRFDDDRRHTIYSVPFGGGKPRVLVRNAAAPSWAR